jgi:hypothetical protein
MEALLGYIDRRFVQVLLPVRSETPWENVRYRLIHEAASRNRLPITLHAWDGWGMAPTPTGTAPTGRPIDGGRWCGFACKPDPAAVSGGRELLDDHLKTWSTPSSGSATKPSSDIENPAITLLTCGTSLAVFLAWPFLACTECINSLGTGPLLAPVPRCGGGCWSRSAASLAGPATRTTAGRSWPTEGQSRPGREQALLNARHCLLYGRDRGPAASEDSQPSAITPGI